METLTLSAETAEKNCELTPREQEIYTMLLDGSTPKEIGYNLKITYGTVITHQKNIYQKLGVHNINEFLIKFQPARNNVSSDVQQFPKETEKSDIFFQWRSISDDDTVVKIIKTNEVINGRNEECVSISSILNNFKHAYSGANGLPNEITLEALRTMKSFSFQTLGDGNDYYVMFHTSETYKGDSCLYVFPFSTVRNEITTFTFKVPDDLMRINLGQKKVEFIQKNIIALNFQAVNPGFYNLKIWDIRLYQ